MSEAKVIEDAGTIVSRVQIVRTWAATPTAREDIPRISNKDCEKVVQWLDDALALLEGYDKVYQPVKPVRVGHAWECGSCHHPVGIVDDDRWSNYCPECGKQVAWEAAK